jgi:hypothetical protein
MALDYTARLETASVDDYLRLRHLAPASAGMAQWLRP